MFDTKICFVFIKFYHRHKLNRIVLAKVTVFGGLEGEKNLFNDQTKFSSSEYMTFLSKLNISMIQSIKDEWLEKPKIHNF